MAVDHLHVLDRHAEAVGGELREGRLVALPVAVAAGEDLDGADRVHAHLRALPQPHARAERAHGGGRREAAGLDEGGVAQAPQLAARRRLGPALGEAGDVGRRLRLVQQRREIAAVILHDDLRLIGELGDEVPPAQLGRVHPHLARGGLHHPLDHVGGLGPPRAAIGVHRHRVGEDGPHRAVDRGDVVLPRPERAVEIGGRHRGEERGVGAQIGDRVDVEGDDLALIVEAHPALGDMVAAMGVGQEGLRPVGGPFHRAARLHRGPEAGDLLGVDVDLRAEAPAHVGRHHAQLVLGGDVVEGREHQPGDMRVLAGGVERVVILRLVVDRDGRARLHRVGAQAIVDDVELGDVRGALERLLRLRLVADLPRVAEVAGDALVHLRRAVLQGLVGEDGGRELLDVERHRLGGATGEVLRLGDDDGHGVAHVAAVFGDHRVPRADLHRRAVLGGDGPARDDVADAVGLHLGAGMDGDHALHRQRRGGVDALDAGMGHRTAHEGGVGLVLHADVVGILAPAGDEAAVFLAGDARADALIAHPCLPYSAACAWPAISAAACWMARTML